MKVRITAKMAYEFELHPHDYADVEGVSIKTDDDILAFERLQVEEQNSGLIEGLFEAGELSDVTIEKIEETEEKEDAA